MEKRNNMKFLKVVFVLFVLCSVLCSCSKKKEEVIVFDNSYPLALAPDVSWAVVTDPYAAYKKNPEWVSEVLGHCRKGDILQVMGKSTDSNNDDWYSFETGWLPASCIAIYSNRFKAKTASDLLGE